jgi:hypothetical protein
MVFGRLVLIGVLVGAALLGGRHAAAQPFVPEVQVGSRDIIDYEFDWGRDGLYCQTCNYGAGNARLSYIDREHNLWVGYVDFATGNFLPSDGRALLVDVNATASSEIGNGPEWMVSARGSELVYTRWTDGQPHGPQYMGLGYARPSNSSWVAGLVAGSGGRAMPVGSLDVADATPAMHYQNVAIGNLLANIYWRDVVSGSVESKLPFNNNNPGMTRRWVPGTRDIIVTAPALNPGDGQAYNQVFLYHTTTGVREQLTYDPVDKIWAFMWRAPEYGDELVFFVLVGQTRIDVYRNLPRADGSQRWRVVSSITAPADTPYMSSPEPFVHNGKSWLFFSVTADPDLHKFSRSQIAITGIDPTKPSFRILTADDPARSRRDPEYFITANGPYIYYNRYLLPTDTSPQVSEGVFRVDTGLGPRLP